MGTAKPDKYSIEGGNPGVLRRRQEVESGLNVGLGMETETGDIDATHDPKI